MPHFLIADDEVHIRKSIRLLLESQGHTCEEAGDLLPIIKAIEHSESHDGEPFDLILLDYNFDVTNGLEIIEMINEVMGQDYCEHRVVAVTGNYDRSLASQFAESGAIGHLNKPITEVQFWSTVDAALTRRTLYVDKKYDWEAALELLGSLGILERVESLQELTQQYETLKHIHESLLKDLESAGGRDQKVAQAYAKASEAVNQASGSFESIYKLLQGFGYTRSFLSDAEGVFHSDRLHFIALQSYLQRIFQNPESYLVKHLFPGATGHYEYRVGRSFRLYFRKNECGKIIWERFGHKNIQKKIIQCLNKSEESDASV
jgi:CheY-like chemotaxis protein